MQESPAREVVDRHLDHGRPTDVFPQLFFFEAEKPGGILQVPGIRTGPRPPDIGTEEPLQLFLLMGRSTQTAVRQVDPGVDPEIPEPDLVPEID